MAEDWIFSAGDAVCELRAAGLLIREKKILLQEDIRTDEFAFPGGHVQVGETTETAVIREFQEELGVRVKVERLAFSDEVFWENRHSLDFYYLIHLEDESSISDNFQDFSKDNESVKFEWRTIDEAASLPLYPEIIKKQLLNIKDYPQHFVEKE